MKITKLRIINYLGIKRFVADKLGKINEITGDNDVGKTTILNAIQEVFKSSGIDPALVHNDADEAEIMIEIDGRYLAERHITHDDNDVAVQEGKIPIKKPATFLAELLGAYNFRPVDFFLAKPKERREMFLSAIDFKLSKDEIENILGDDSEMLDWSRLDIEKHGLEVLAQMQKQIYDKRHLQGIDVTRLKKAIEQDRRDIPDTFDTDEFKDFDFNTKHAELVEANKQISAHEAEVEKLDALRKRAKRIAIDIEDRKQKILELTDELQEIENKFSGINSSGKELAVNVKSFEAPDIESMNASIEAYNGSQELIAKIKEIDNREDKLQDASEIHSHLDEIHKELTTSIPQELLANMKLPVDDIEITGDDIICHGVPIERMSTSEKIEFAMDAAKAFTGKLKAICVDGLESLSADKRKNFRTEAEKSDDEFQYFTTQVTDGPLKMKSSNDTEKKSTEKKATKRKTITKKKSDDGKQTEVEF